MCVDQIVNYVTCIAAVGLVIATCALVWVTVHHARSAERMAAAADRLGEMLDRETEKMAAAADRLGEIVDRQAKELVEVVELSTLVSGLTSAYVASTSGYHNRLMEIIRELEQRRGDRVGKGGRK
jgi:hypothetical protein